MEGYKLFREAVESVSSAAVSWQELSSGTWFGLDELRRMGDVYDEVTEPDGWNYFVTFEGSGEICLASTCSREIKFLFVPEGSRYEELIAAREKRNEELREIYAPVLGQMVLDKLDEHGRDPSKVSGVFHRDTAFLAEEFLERAGLFIKPGSGQLPSDIPGNADAANVLRILHTPGLTENAKTARNNVMSAATLIETDKDTVLERMNYCVNN